MLSIAQTALAVGAAALALGAVVLLRWMCEPIVDARRLARAQEPPQERTFPDPAAATERPFASIADAPRRSLSIIVPAFNEENRIVATLRDMVAFFNARAKRVSGFTYEIIVVDDHSSDRTVDVVLAEVQSATADCIRLLRLGENHGKGGAIRKGVLRAEGECILFADADNATDVRDYEKLQLALTEAVAGGAGGVLVCGSRAHLEEQAIAKRHPLRNVLMHGFHFIVATLCVNSVRDTQCGFKLFDRSAARLLFAPMHIERWAFDVELLYVAALRGLAIKEVAVAWHEVPGSKLSVISATLTMLRELILIRVCYTLGIWTIHDGGFRLRKE